MQKKNLHHGKNLSQYVIFFKVEFIFYLSISYFHTFLQWSLTSNPPQALQCAQPLHCAPNPHSEVLLAAPLSIEFATHGLVTTLPSALYASVSGLQR